jgi:allophanate hydrolase
VSAPAAPGSARRSIAVVGAHLAGQPLHHELAGRGARLVAATVTAPEYRLFALDTSPRKPGLVRVLEGGAPVAVEVWSLAADAWGDVVDTIPAPLCLGRVMLADGTSVAGFLCEPYATIGARDITDFGGWRAFVDSGRSGQP